MKRPSHIILLTLIIAVLTSYICVQIFLPQDFKPTEKKETAYDRVMRTGVIRCGFWNWPPLTSKDPKTQQFSGIFVDIMAEFQRLTEIKVEWAHEVLYSNVTTDLEMGKVDAICAGVWPSASRAKSVLYTQPIFYVPIQAFTSADNLDFDYKLEIINQKKVKFVTMDGEMSGEIRRVDFPESSEVSIPQITGHPSELLLSVATKKGDVTFVDGFNGAFFMANNPGKIRAVKTHRPYRLMPNTISVDDESLRLKLYIDDVINQMFTSGLIDKILVKYKNEFPNAIIRPDQRYEELNS